MTPAFITKKLITLIKRYKPVAEQLTDLNELSTQYALTNLIDKLNTYNVLHTERIEGDIRNIGPETNKTTGKTIASPLFQPASTLAHFKKVTQLLAKHKKKRLLNEQKQLLNEQKQLLNEKKRLLNEQKQLLNEQKQLLNEQKQLLNEKKRLLDEQNQLMDEQNQLMDEQSTELEHFFLQLDYILASLVKLTLPPMTTVLLCTQAAFISNKMGHNGKDNPYDAATFLSLLNKLNTQDTKMTLLEWNHWERYILWVMSVINGPTPIKDCLDDKPSELHKDCFDDKPSELHQAVIDNDFDKVEAALAGLRNKRLCPKPSKANEASTDDINAYTDKYAPIHHSVINGNSDILEMLLADPIIDINATCMTNASCTALHLAAKEGNLGIIKQLLRVPRIDLTCTNVIGLTALGIAVYFEQLEAAEYLLSQGSVFSAGDVHATNQGETLLHIAVNTKNTAVIAPLMFSVHKYGANPNETTYDTQQTALHYAVLKRQKDIADTIIRNLLKNKRPLDLKDIEKQSPLDHAVSRNYREIVALFDEPASVLGKRKHPELH